MHLGRSDTNKDVDSPYLRSLWYIVSNIYLLAGKVYTSKRHTRLKALGDILEQLKTITEVQYTGSVRVYLDVFAARQFLQTIAGREEVESDVACDKALPCVFLLLALQDHTRSRYRGNGFLDEVRQNVRQRLPSDHGTVMDHVVGFSFQLFLVEGEDIAGEFLWVSPSISRSGSRCGTYFA